MSHKIKIRPGRVTVLSPLPKRNRRHALLTRIGHAIRNDEDLYRALQFQPHYMRDAYLRELWPYLKFTPRMPQPTDSVSE